MLAERVGREGRKEQRKREGEQERRGERERRRGGEKGNELAELAGIERVKLI